MNTQQQIDYQNAQTNHILHLLLTVITGGLWLAVWLIVAINNSSKRKKILRSAEIEQAYETGRISEKEYKFRKTFNTDYLVLLVLIFIYVLVSAGN